MSLWRWAERAVAKHTLATVALALLGGIACALLIERVMDHGYGVDVQWSELGRVKFTPPAPSAPQTLTRNTP